MKANHWALALSLAAVTLGGAAKACCASLIWWARRGRCLERHRTDPIRSPSGARQWRGEANRLSGYVPRFRPAR